MKKVICLACLISLACSQAYADKLAVSEKSSVVIVLKHTPPGKDGKPPRTMTLSVEDSTIQNLPAPNGKVFDLPSRPGATFRFRIEGFNTLKYSAKETPTAAEEPKLTLPDVISKAFEGLIAKKSAPSEADKKTDWYKALQRF